MKKSTLVLFVSALLLFSSCREEDITGPILIPITDGAYILSEGTNSTNSRLSFYSVSNDSFYQKIYNGNLAYPDGLLLFQGSLYLVEQGPNFGGNGRIYNLDTNGNIIKTSNPFGSSPYSLATANYKIYVTNGPGSSVSVLDLSSFNPVRTINVGIYPQEILATVNKVFVCNTSAFGGQNDSTLSVINVLTDSVNSVITLRKDPASIIETFENGMNYIYAGCQGGGGIIYKIQESSLNKVDSFSLANGFDKDMVYHEGNIYFISAANNIDRLDLINRAVTTIITNPAPGTAYFYGYNYDILNGKHYVLDAKNFQVNGSLYIYNSSGSLEKTFTAGVAPRRVVFKFGTGIGGS